MTAGLAVFMLAGLALSADLEPAAAESTTVVAQPVVQGPRVDGGSSISADDSGALLLVGLATTVVVGIVARRPGDR